MLSLSRSVLGSRAVLVLGLAVATTSVGSTSAISAQGCKKVSGKFTLQPVGGPTCQSPVGICATGVYKGDVAGTSVFTGSSLIPTVDTPTTAVVILTGDNVIETADGTLTTKDAIALRTTGAGEFAEVDTIVAGTGDWEGATGVLTAKGTFTTAAGGQASYTGQVCTP